MAELDLTEAIEAGAAAINGFRVFRADDGHPAIRVGTDEQNARVVVEAAAPVIERAAREQVAQELLAAGADPAQNLAWMYPEQAATIARNGRLPAPEVPR